jgi:hypothetical protein
MKTYAGDLYVELPGQWDDESQYVYRDSEADIEIRFEPSPVDPAATPDELLEPMIERLGLLGPLQDVQRGQTRVLDQDAATLALTCQREGDSEATLMQAIVFKPAPGRAMTITAFAVNSDAQRKVLGAAWSRLLGTLKFVELD